MEKSGEWKTANKILTLQENRKTPGPWVKEVHWHQEKFGIRKEDI